MSDAVSPGGEVFSKHRVEALVDAVFAVVMTLLVLEIKPELEPHANDEAVRHTLRALALPLTAYAFAFLISCVFWNLHHRKFHLLRHTNTRHTALTLVFLFAVTLLPISISLFLHAKDSGLAKTVYFGNFTIIALTLLISWLYARQAGLAETDTKTAAAVNLTTRMYALVTLGVISMVASYFNWPYLLLLVVPVFIYVRRLRKAAAP